MSDKNNLAEEAYTYIKEKLYNFDILPEQTVSDFLLSKQLNMSRTPIRQALQMLKNDGLLEEIPGSSSTYKVSAISEEEIQDIFDYREALELSALSLACEKGRIDSSVIEKLQKIVDKISILRSSMQPAINESPSLMMPLHFSWNACDCSPT